MLLGLALAVTACAGSGGSGKTTPPQFGAIPPKYKKACAKPGELPDRDLTQAEVERYWGKDRAGLINCAATKQGLVKFIEDRDRRIGGNK
jgi:hypothetical protein